MDKLLGAISEIFLSQFQKKNFHCLIIARNSSAQKTKITSQLISSCLGCFSGLFLLLSFVIIIISNMASHQTPKMPVLFVGHGSPMNALEDNPTTESWKAIARNLPRPQAILCISAHWETNGSKVTISSKPETIHDFGGFPPELFRMQYPAPGAPEWAERTRALVKSTTISSDTKWGLDHGAWSVLCRFFPKADIPVFQLSLDRNKTPQQHYNLGIELSPLREQGVLIVCSGNIVHNLGLIDPSNKINSAYDWAKVFDTKVRDLIQHNQIDQLINFKDLGKEANLSIPTAEHYLPLLYALALKEQSDPIKFFAEHYVFGSLAMRSVKIGN